MRYMYLLSLVLLLALTENILMQNDCKPGEKSSRGKCVDEDECEIDPSICGKKGKCFNTAGSFYCQCHEGFTPRSTHNFTQDGAIECEDIDECTDGSINCGPHTVCGNSEGGYYCACYTGYISSNGKDIFNAGQGVQCIELKCNRLLRESGTSPTSPELTKLISSMSNSCLALSQSDSVMNNTQVNGEKLLKAFLSDLDNLPQGGFSGDTYIISALFRIVIMTLKWIGHLLSESQTRKTSTKADVELLVKRDNSPPEGHLMMNVSGAQLTSNWSTATGNKSLGFPTAALLSYKGLEKSLNCCFNQLKTHQNQTFKINSKVVTATFSNYETANLKKPIKLTFYHLEKKSEKHVCVFWDSEVEGGAWSTDGCTTERSSVHQTVCSCYKLGSFAVLTTLCDTGLCRPTLNFCQQGSKP